MQFKIGDRYMYDQIQSFAEENEYEMEEFGWDLPGSHFILIAKDEGNRLAASFMLVVGNLYECVFTNSLNFK